MKGTLVTALYSHAYNHGTFDGRPNRRAFVDRFKLDRGHGIPHGVKVFDIAKEMVDLSGIELERKQFDSLQCASLLHDIADIKDAAEYRSVFGNLKVTNDAILPIVEGVQSESKENAYQQISEFNMALSQGRNLRPFHNLTGSLFADNLLSNSYEGDAIKEKFNIDDKTVAQAIFYHSERKLELIPNNIVVRLLRDADKIEGLDLQRLIDINTKAGRVFFDPSIPFSLRVEMLSGRIRPEEQEARDPGLKLDTFQFAGVRSLFLDTNPDMYALPDIANTYLRKHELFNTYLEQIIAATGQYNTTLPELQERNLRVLYDLLLIAENDDRYARNVDLINNGFPTLGRA